MNNTFYRHIGILIAFYILFQSFSNLAVSRTLWPYLNGSEFITELVLNFTIITIIYATNYTIVFIAWKHFSAKKKLLLDILTSCICMVIAKYLYRFLFPDMHILHDHVTWADTIFDNIFILIGLEIAYFVRNHIWRIQEINKNKQKIMQYQNDALRAQVNPHFLFNTLNMLYSLVGKDNEKSKLFILSLSNIYRYMLDQQGRDKVVLTDEIRFVKEYISILTYRYNNRFNVEINGIPEHQKYIIPFTLQLLIENVVKHNKLSINEPMTVMIQFEKEFLTVSNPINRKEQVQSSRIGMEYIRQLYKAYGKHIEVKDDNITFTVKIPYIS